ncbi:MAG: PmoA family protein [Akkermansiaceae bacterium]|nr:PmoA family protein [Akkermansiaceae bacterium]
MKTILLLMAMTLTASAATPAPVTPLRAPGGPHIADWQPQANPKKSYIAQLFAPAAKPFPLLEDSPADHVHHHGLMLALGGDPTDFWTEVGVPNSGTQQPVGSTPFADGDGFSHTLHWLATDGTRVLDETRSVRVRASGTGVDAVHWLDWQSVLTPAPGRESVKLWGHHYFGLGLRLAPQWSNKGTFLWQDTRGQTTVRGDEKLTPGRWCAATLTDQGQPVTVLMLSHPDNPRPGAWFTMSQPFCYLSATYDLEKNPFVLAKGQSWTLRHSLAVFGKPTAAAALEQAAQAWKFSLNQRFPIQPQPKP